MKLDSILKIITTTAIVVAALSFSYYFLYFLPQKERVSQERYDEQKVANCIKDVDETFKPTFETLVNDKREASSEERLAAMNYLSSLVEQAKARCKSL